MLSNIFMTIDLYKGSWVSKGGAIAPFRIRPQCVTLGAFW